MRQYLDPQFIYAASIRVTNNGQHEFRTAYAVNKDTLRNYAKWIDADRFDKLLPHQQEEILKTIGLQRWAKGNELEFTYDDAKKCIAACYGDDDYMHSEYSDAYSEDGDMTFIMRYDYYHLDGAMDTNVTGFYRGMPNEQDDEIYKETVVAKSEGEEE